MPDRTIKSLEAEIAKKHAAEMKKPKGERSFARVDQLRNEHGGMICEQMDAQIEAGRAAEQAKMERMAAAR